MLFFFSFSVAMYNISTAITKIDYTERTMNAKPHLETINEVGVLSDDYKSGKECKFHYIEHKNIQVKKLDFSKMEKEFVCNIPVKAVEIPKELLPELESALRNKGLLKS